MNSGRIPHFFSSSSICKSHVIRVQNFIPHSNHIDNILVNSFYDSEKDEVCAFEELIGSHGGIGGSQSEPFILYPSTWKVSDEEIVGAESIYRILKDNLKKLKEGGGKD